MTSIGTTFPRAGAARRRGLTPSSLAYAPTGGRWPARPPAAPSCGGPTSGLVMIKLLRRHPAESAAADAVADLPRRRRGQRRHAADLVTRADWPGRCRDRDRPRTAGRSPGAAPAHPRQRPARPGRGLGGVQPPARPSCCRPGSRCAAKANYSPAPTPTSSSSTAQRVSDQGRLAEQHPAIASLRHVLVNGTFVTRTPMSSAPPPVTRSAPPRSAAQVGPWSMLPFAAWPLTTPRSRPRWRPPKRPGPRWGCPLFRGRAAPRSGLQLLPIDVRRGSAQALAAAQRRVVDYTSAAAVEGDVATASTQFRAVVGPAADRG